MAKKNSVVKKSSKTESHKKASPKHASKHVKEKKVENVIENKEPLEDKVFGWKVFSFVVLALLLISWAVFFYFYYGHSNPNVVPINNNTNNNVINQSPNVNGGAVTLTIVTSKDCSNCANNDLITAFKEKVFTNLKVNTVYTDSTFGKDVVKTLNPEFLPIMLFSTNIENNDKWSQIQSAFKKVDIDGKTYYKLSEVYIQNKEILSAPKILPNATVIGNKDAKVTIYEFSDYQCPYCGIAEGNPELLKMFEQRVPGYVPPVPNFYKDYVETGKVKWVFYDFPIKELHPYSRLAHLASLCARDQGKWLPYHEYLYINRSSWIADNEDKVISNLKAIAGNLSLNMNEFDNCLDSKKYDSFIDKEIAYGKELGVSGTPAFFIGKTFISGAQNYSVFKKDIDAALASANQ